MKKKVKVMVLENVDKLGLKGDIKKLAKGYVKNYLLPKKMVVLLSDPRAKKIIKGLEKERREIEQEVSKLKKLAETIAAKEITIMSKAGEKGKLFGSVTSEDIAKEFKLDKKIIKMAPIKTTGKHSVEINLGYGIMAKAIVNVEITDKKFQEKKSAKKNKK